MSGIIQNFSFCNWLISLSILSPKFIYVLKCPSFLKLITFYFIYITYFIYSFRAKAF